MCLLPLALQLVSCSVDVDPGGSNVDGGSRPDAPGPCNIAGGGCHPLAGCMMTEGRSVCGLCPKGTKDTNGDGSQCTDIDECKESIDDCDDAPPAFCINTMMGYRCQCSPGFIDADPSMPGRDCVDPTLYDGGVGIDECSEGIDACDDDPDSCVDMPVGYQCQCPAGTVDFNGNGTDCRDIDECVSTENTCDRAPVATCINTVGSYRCECPDGYVDPSGRNCVNVNECALGTDACDDDPVGTCVDVAGGYTCSCPTGYADSEEHQCENVDECELDTDNCDDEPEATCTDTEGSFDCECPLGYTDPTGTNCVNINECALASDSCDRTPIAVCTDTQGGFTCACPMGYEDLATQGANCVNINECTRGTHNCDTDPVATCQDNAGSFTCTCPMGYSDPTGRNCVNIDECAMGMDTCDEIPDACVDGLSGFTCACPDGYDDVNSDGSVCEDIDECDEEIDECDIAPVAECINTEGSYTCTCPDGYADPDGQDCQPVNECDLDSDDCDDSPDACVDETPGYACVCPPGYDDVDEDGTFCRAFMTPIDDPEGPPYLGLYPLGLYPGSNTMPAAHRAEGIARANQIEPLDIDGNPDPGGRIVLLSIGMSNTQIEFCTGDPSTPPTLDPQDSSRVQCNAFSLMGRARNPNEAVNRTTLSIVNGAYAGQDAEQWVTTSQVSFPPMPPNPAYPTVMDNYDRIRDHVFPRYTPQVSEAQVQIAWVKLTIGGATIALPDPNAEAFVLEGILGSVIRRMKDRYPNLKLVFFSSRLYGGYAAVAGYGEPYNYESGLSVKWLIEAQMDQVANGGTVVDARAGDLNYETEAAPWLAWGPYMWANGEDSRRSDGLAWTETEFGPNEGVHPTNNGTSKVGLMLMRFFQTSPFTNCWFMEAGACE